MRERDGERERWRERERERLREKERVCVCERVCGCFPVMSRDKGGLVYAPCGGPAIPRRRPGGLTVSAADWLRRHLH